MAMAPRIWISGRKFPSGKSNAPLLCLLFPASFRRYVLSPTKAGCTLISEPNIEPKSRTFPREGNTIFIPLSPSLLRDNNSWKTKKE